MINFKFYIIIHIVEHHNFLGLSVGQNECSCQVRQICDKSNLGSSLQISIDNIIILSPILVGDNYNDLSDRQDIVDKESNNTR